jgi:aromatic-L-amino-acid decarboxylase
MARIARQYGLWLHVDAAMAGSAMVLPECRWMWEGIEGADSLVLNPHKWLGAAFDCSLYYVRDPEHLIRVMSTSPSYLRTAADDKVKNLRDWGLPLGRRFRALKLWFLIREQGVAGLQARLRRDLANAQWLLDEIRQTPDWRVLAPVPLQTLVRPARASRARPARRSTPTPRLGPTASIAPARRTLRRPSSTDGGWSASPSAPCSPSASMSRSSGG